MDNFPVSGRTLRVELIRAIGLVKWAAAKVNWNLGKLAPSRGRGGKTVKLPDHA